MADHNVICQHCQRPAQFVDSKIVYHKSYGMIYYCACKPGGAWVGCHKGTTKPLGTLADKETRQWRMKAHEKFDPIWHKRLKHLKRKNKEAKQREARDGCYRKLADLMSIYSEKCHIGMFDSEQCKQVIALCDAGKI